VIYLHADKGKSHHIRIDLDSWPIVLYAEGFESCLNYPPVNYGNLAFDKHLQQAVTKSQSSLKRQTLEETTPTLQVRSVNLKWICDIVAPEVPDNFKEPFLKPKPCLLRYYHGGQNKHRMLRVLEIEPCIA